MLVIRNKQSLIHQQTDERKSMYTKLCNWTCFISCNLYVKFENWISKFVYRQWNRFISWKWWINKSYQLFALWYCFPRVLQLLHWLIECIRFDIISWTNVLWITFSMRSGCSSNEQQIQWKKETFIRLCIYIGEPITWLRKMRMRERDE